MQFYHIILATLVAAIWGLNFIAIKTGLSDIPPLLYTATRMALASLPIFFLAKKPPTSWSLILGIGVSVGIIKFSLLFLGLYTGMSAGLASLVLQSQVFFTVGLSVLCYGEKIHLNQAIGMVLSFLGIVIISMNLTGGSTLIGFLLVLASAFSWSVSNILIKQTGNVDMFALVVWTSLIPPLPLYLFSWIFEGPLISTQTLTQISFLGWACLLFTVCGATWVGYTLWGVLLRAYDASLIAPFSLLVPIFGISFAHTLLGEQFTLMTYIACGLVFLGLIINQWRMPRTLPELVAPQNSQALDKVA